MRVIFFLIFLTGAFVNSYGQLYINEYVSSNYNGITDEDDEYPDWFEIYNNSNVAVNLTNYSVTDDITLTGKWKFPSISIQPYTYLLIFASGKDRSLVTGNLHTNFKLGSEGEGLYLLDATSTFVDSIKPAILPANISYGRKPDGSNQWYYFENPTPGEINSTIGVTAVNTDTVFFSMQGGKHIGGLSLTLSSDNTDDSIYYTTDGSIPDKSEDLYTSPISVYSDRVVRARIINSNSIPGPVFTNTYATQLDHEFPIICLSTDPENLWDENTGIFVLGPPDYEAKEPHYGANYWEDWEKPTHFELYDKAGVKQIDQISGMKVFGGWSRMNDQKSVAMFARKVYGKGSFAYKFFDKKPIDKFESIVLRNGGNDFWGLRFQDEFLTSLTDEMDVDKQASQPAAIYLNGSYWGILNIREKVNENFIAENHHVNADEVNLLDCDRSALFGNNEKYESMIFYLGTHPTLSDNTMYNWVANQMDIDNYIQYQLTEIYIDNGDWPGNNMKYWNTSSPFSKWRWILFDTDFGFGLQGNYQHNTLSFALDPDCGCTINNWPNPPWSTLLFRRMVSNIGFRNNFINQYADRINTDFQPDVVINKIDSFKALYNTDFQFHSDRWGESYDYWLSLIEVRKNFATNRPTYALNHIEDVFNLGGQLYININVFSADKGKVKLNSVIPKSYPFNGVYFKNIPISMTAIPNPGYKFVRWQGTVNSTNRTIDYDMSANGSFTAVFTDAVPEDISVVINEINYNSSVTYAPKDWIEILNNGKTTVDLSGWLISDTGADTGFVFPAGSILIPGDYLVIYTDLEYFKTIFPNITNICGGLPFGLSSNGDQIFLYDQDRNLVDYVKYDNSFPWDANANGTGATLELLNSSIDNSLATSWQAGVQGGTPGSMNKWSNSTDIQSDLLTLNQNNFTCFPNPFRDYTTISFDVVTESYVQLEVFDINGKLVNSLVAEYLVPGRYFIDWTGNSSDMINLPLGIYNVRLYYNSEVHNLKIVKL
jgi:hypothetical protein